MNLMYTDSPENTLGAICVTYCFLHSDEVFVVNK